MRVLFGGVGLDEPELSRVVRSAVDDFWRKGHKIFVWTIAPDRETRALRRSGVTTFHDLAAVPDDIDVLQAFHPAAAVLMRRALPHLPLVYWCQSGSPRHLPPDSDANIQRWVAHGKDVAERLRDEGVPADLISTLDEGLGDLAQKLLPIYEQAIRGFSPSEVGRMRELETLAEDLLNRSGEGREDPGRLAGSEEALRTLEQELARREADAFFRLGQRLRSSMESFAPWGTRRRSFVLAPVRAVRLLRAVGWADFVSRLGRPHRWIPRLFVRRLPPPDYPQDRVYRVWLATVLLSRQRLRQLHESVEGMPRRPSFTVLIPFVSGQPSSLKRALDSVRAQLYPFWQARVCLAGEGPTEAAEVAEVAAREDDRIAVVRAPSGGPALALNEGLARSDGDFIGVLEPGDELGRTALAEVAAHLGSHPDAELVYTDEDQRGADGQRARPFFKPGWSKDLLLATNYLGGLTLYRRSLISRLEGFRSDFEPAHDHDLALRAAEATDRVSHVPFPCYTAASRAGRTPARSDDPRVVDASRRAVADSLERRGSDAVPEGGLRPGCFRVRYRIAEPPPVTIIVPTRDRVELLRRCVEGVRSSTTYPSYDVMIVDNESAEPETLAYLDSFDGRVIRYPGPFRYAAMMNDAVSMSGDSPFILFLNNDTEVISGGWLTAMVEHAQRPEVGVVGARLLFPDGTPQHEGIALGLGGECAVNLSHGGYFGLGEVVRNVSAVTGACMLLRREVFEELGGFDVDLTVAYNDVDLCLRAREKGYSIVYTPHATLIHAEGSTRKGRHPRTDEARFRERWGDPDAIVDAYYNPSLSRARPFTIALDELAVRSA